MIKKIVLGQIRHLLGAGGTGFASWLVANGASTEDAELIISGAIALIGFAWSAWEKYKDAKKETSK